MKRHLFIPILAVALINLAGCRKDATLQSTLKLQVLHKNLEVPWGMAYLPNGDFIFCERSGTINIQKKGESDYNQVLVRIVNTGEGGLLGMAVDPDFNSNHYLYIYETITDANQVVRLSWDNGNITPDKVILGGIPRANNHDGGALKFGPDGYLYVGTGDALDAPIAQDINNLGGKILRIDREGNPAPANPFGNEVWTYGHRNIQGFDWSPQGAMLATEHGPSGEYGWCCHDEVNLIEPGKNYGWPLALAGTETDTLTAPLIQSGDDTWAPSGCTFVHGAEWGKWNGKFIACGLRSQKLLIFELNGSATEVITLTDTIQEELGRLRNIIQAPDGSLIFTSSNVGHPNWHPLVGDDKIYRLYWD